MKTGSLSRSGKEWDLELEVPWFGSIVVAFRVQAERMKSGRYGVMAQ
jgi:hypothetical protein